MKLRLFRSDTIIYNDITYYFKLYWNGDRFCVVKEIHLENTGYGEAQYFDDFDDALSMYILVYYERINILESENDDMEVYIL